LGTKKKIKDNVKRDWLGKCIICGDTSITSSGDCFYCNWKGLSGPGALLKEIIKEENKKVR
jgi:hypothetical protein